MSDKIVKVSSLVHYLKGKLDSDMMIQNILVQGEISNFTNHRSGHWYFSLKDDKARMSCVMFASYASKSNFVPKEGDKVIIKCSTSLFESTGQMQLYVSAIKMDGLGDLFVQYEKLKKQLSSEGLFDEDHKLPIPSYPMNICLITGKSTAAREDVISTLAKRWPVAKISEYPVLVQGEGSASQIVNALKVVDKMQFDVILLVRGGGSIEDLWSFNDETLARTIYNLKTPLVSGVGHETDTTIVDYVSDLRAPTPTGAAQLATPDINEVKESLLQNKRLCINEMSNILKHYQTSFNNCANSYVFKNPSRLVEKPVMQIDLNYKRLMVIKDILNNYRNALNNNRMHLKDEIIDVTNTNQKRVDYNNLKMQQAMSSKLQYEKDALQKHIGLLDAYSPLKVMKRGYSLVYKDDELINDVNHLKDNDEIKIKLSKGDIKAKVISRKD